MADPPHPGPIHYGWVIVATGTLCIFACLGFGRFALGMQLPSMGAGLSLSYAQLGAVGTINFLGYLGAMLVVGRIAARFGPRRTIAAGLVAVGGSMLLLSRAGGFGELAALYAVTGFGSGAANVPVMGLVARWFQASLRGRAAGFVAIGSGFAIVVSGRLIPWVNQRVGAEGWRVSWALLGAAVLAVALLAALLLRDRPEEKGLSPCGVALPAPSRPARPGAAPRRGAVPILGLVYACFGYTYAIYVTFLVTMLVRERGFPEATAGAFWSAVGLLSLLSGPVFGSLSDRLGRRTGLAMVFSLQLAAYLLAAGRLPEPFLYLSIGCFGVTAWAVPTIMLAAVGDYVGPDRALGTLGLVTFFFGIGQVAGPAVAGLLAERTGGFSAAFTMAAGVAALAIVGAALLGPPGEAPAARDT